MKFIQLTRKYRVYNEMGHRVGLRFDTFFSKGAREAELAAKELLGVGTVRGFPQVGNCCWCEWFGQRRWPNKLRPYYITFLNESDCMMVMLRATAELTPHDD